MHCAMIWETYWKGYGTNLLQAVGHEILATRYNAPSLTVIQLGTLIFIKQKNQKTGFL